MKISWGMLAWVPFLLCGTVQAGEIKAVPSAKHEQRLTDRRTVENHPFSDFGQDYLDAKHGLQDKLGLQIGVDVSYTAQRVSPSGKQTSIQGIYYPYLTWNLFTGSSFGSGQINVNYNLIRYWGTEGGTLQGRTGAVSGLNDYLNNEEIFSQASYTHTLPGDLNWLSVTVGQFPMYNFDGTTYVDNQQTALINYAMSQNASSTYASAGLGAYVQAAPGEWSFTAGYQDAGNISGQNIRVKDAFNGEYTAFGSIGWNPSDVAGLGSAQYSVLGYYQPAVSEQDEYSAGWSVNAQQNVGEKWAFFGRANGSNGNVTTVKQSYVLGGSFLNPLGRNPQDAITLGVAYNRLSGKALGYPQRWANGETAVELQWVWGVGKFVTVTPDVQVYPKAATGERDFTTVASLRTTVML